MPDISSPYDAMTGLFRSFLPPAIAAPQQLTQPIFSGWSLLTVNETNSKAPDTEAAIVAKASYGRQIGWLLDAVVALVGELPEAKRGAAEFVTVTKLAATVKTAKDEAAIARLARLTDDLVHLRSTDRDEFDRQRTALLALLNEPVPQRGSSAHP